MAGDDFTIVFASLGLVYPERAQFTGSDVPGLYAKLTARYPFESLRNDRDSADLRQEAQRAMFLTRSSVILEEHVTQDFSLTGRVFSDIVRETQDHFSIPVFWEPEVILRAHIPAPDGDAAALMRARAISFRSDQLAPLGEIGGLTLVVEAIDRRAEHVRYVRVDLGSSLRDISQMQIELSLHEPRQIESAPDVEQYVQEAYEYFNEQVMRFAKGVLFQ